MNNKVNLYKEISLELLESLKNGELDIIDEKLQKREDILEDIDNINEFRETCSKEGLLEIEKEISNLFNIKVHDAKNELMEYKISKQANNTYVNLSKEKLNIFNKKV